MRARINAHANRPHAQPPTRPPLARTTHTSHTHASFPLGHEVPNRFRRSHTPPPSLSLSLSLSLVRLAGVGFLFVRYCIKPDDLWDWLSHYLEDPEEVVIDEQPPLHIHVSGRTHCLRYRLWCCAPSKGRRGANGRVVVQASVNLTFVL